MVRFKVCLIVLARFPTIPTLFFQLTSLLSSSETPFLTVSSTKNRWFLVEFLYPSSQPVSPSPSIQLNSPDSDPTVSSIPTLTPHSGPPKRVPPSRQGDASRKKPKLATGTRRSKDDSDDDAADQVSDTEDESDVEYDSAVNLDDEANPGLLNQNLGPMPLFLPPAPNPTTGKIKRLDEKSIHQALKASVIQTFGDDGWGRVGANTSGE